MKKQKIHVDSIFGRIEAYSNDLITDQIMEFGNHTRPEFAFALAALDFDMNVFDIGAHIGTFSMAALGKIKKGQKLLSVEGNPDTFELLTRNCSNRGSAEITLLNTFIGENGDFSYRSNENNTGAGHLMKADKSQNLVDIISVDTLVQKYFAPDYLKMDIEGAEYLALQNCKFLKSNRPIVYMEVSSDQLSHFGHTIEMLDSLFLQMDYKFFVNSGVRNAKHDFFKVREIKTLNGYKPFFDVLCVPAKSALIPDLLHIS